MFNILTLLMRENQEVFEQEQDNNNQFDLGLTWFYACVKILKKQKIYINDKFVEV